MTNKINNPVVFVVESVKRLESDESRVALLKFRIPEEKIVTHDTFYLNSTQESKIRSFFESIGKVEPGKSFNMDWNDLVGQCGLCKINNDGIIEAYLNGLLVDLNQFGENDMKSLNEEIEEQTEHYSNYVESCKEEDRYDLDNMTFENLKDELIIAYRLGFLDGFNFRSERER